MLEAYGSAAQKQPEDVALLGQSEGYVEYNAQGRVIKGQVLPVSCLTASMAVTASMHVGHAGGRQDCLHRPMMQNGLVLLLQIVVVAIPSPVHAPRAQPGLRCCRLARHVTGGCDSLVQPGSLAATTRHESSRAAVTRGRVSLHGWAPGTDKLMPTADMQARTRYEENVCPGNHTSVFGSWWQDGQWGFACCHQTTKNSYCTGEAGLRADARAEQRLAENLEARARQLESSQATTSAPAAKVCVTVSLCRRCSVPGGGC